jgi:hypothetical protein
MLPPSPPRREARNELKPPAAFRIPASSAQLRHLRAAAIGHLHTDKTVPRADRHRDRDRPARSTRPAMPDTIAEQLAHQQGGVIPARVVRAENLIRGCDQQRCPPCRPAVMITGHVPAVRLPPDHSDDLMAAAVPA